MTIQEIKNFLTPTTLVSVGTGLVAIVSSVIVIDSRYAHAEDVERTTAQIALDAQESLINFQLDMTSRQIRRLKKSRIKAPLDEEDEEDLQELRVTKDYLNRRQDKIRDQIRLLQKDL